AAGPVSFTVTYSDINFYTNTLTTANITLNRSGSANGSLLLVTNNSTNLTVIVTNVVGDGTLGIAIATNTAVDLASNAAPGAVSTTFTVDNTAPAAPLITGVSPDTGLSSTDAITATNTPAIQGTAEPNSVV